MIGIKNLLKIAMICFAVVLISDKAMALDSNLPKMVQYQLNYIDPTGNNGSLDENKNAALQSSDEELAKMIKQQEKALKYLEEYLNGDGEDEGHADKLTPEQLTAVQNMIAKYKESISYAKEVQKNGTNKKTETVDNEEGPEPEHFDDPKIEEDTPSDQATGANTQQTQTSQTPETETPSDASATLTQTVTTNENGNLTQETTTEAVRATEGGVNVAAADDKNDDDKVTDSDNKKDDADKKEEEQDKNSGTKYTGVYKDRQMIPDTMAIHCKMNAEDVVKDMGKLEGCIRQYVTEMNNANAIDADEGKKDFNKLRYNALNDLLIVGIKKAAAVNDYEDTMNEYAKSTAESQTEFDMEATASNTIAFSNNVQGTIRELASELLKVNAINGFGNVDPSALADEEKSEKAKSVEELEQNSDAAVVKVETKLQVGEDGEEVDASGADDAGGEGEGNGTEMPPAEEVEPTETAPQDAYEQQLANMSMAELQAEMERIKGLQDEYKRYKAEVKDGNAPELDAETKASYESASEKYGKILAEMKKRN